MSYKSAGNRIEPVRTRKSSQKEKQKVASGDIKQAFKMAAGKEGSKKETSELNKERASTAMYSSLSTGETGDNTNASSVKSFVECGVQVSPIDFDDHDDCNPEATSRNIGVSIDSSKEEILDAMRELTEKFDKLDDIVNHPKKGIGAQVVNLVLKGDNLHTDIHSASDGVLKKIAKMQSDIDATKKSVDHVDKGYTRISKMIAENKRLSRDLIMTQGLLQKYSQKIHQLETKILDLTKRGMEQNLVFHAVDEVSDPKGESPAKTITQFVSSFLGIDIAEDDLWKCYRIGAVRTGKARPIFAKLSYAAKDKIMQKVSLLKDKTNTNDQKYFISEQIPEGITEKKQAVSKRVSILKKKEEKKPPAQRLDVKILGEKILVGGEVDKEDVVTPQPYELFPSLEQQSQIDAINQKIKEARPTFSRNSSFVGLAVDIKSTAEANAAYKAVMQRFPFMDHVMMAYNCKEVDEIKYGSCDDTEYGAGACLSKFLYLNVAVFVVRRYGGIHLGYDRFKIIEQSAKAAVQLLRPGNFPDSDQTSPKTL